MALVPVKVENFKYVLCVLWYSIDQKFHAEEIKTNFELLWSLTSMMRPKSQVFNISMMTLGRSDILKVFPLFPYKHEIA
jgi:hypothetical protein